MEYGYSVLMFCFSGALLLYAGLLALTRDVMLIPRHRKVKMRNKKKYALRFAQVTAVMAAAPALSGLVGLFSDIPAYITLIAAFIVCAWIGTKIIRDVMG